MSPASLAEALSRQPHERIVALCVGVAVGLLLLAVCTLNALVRPPGLQQRLDDLDTRLARVEALRAQPGDANGAPPGALCTRPLLTQAAALKSELEQDGRTLRLSQFHVDAQPDVDVSGSRLQPVKFAVDAAGDYASAVHLLQMLDRQTPAVLVDRVDLTSRTTFLRLHLDGRVICAAPQHG